MMLFDPILDLFRGKALTIPPLDGAFRPNTRLDDAEVSLPIAGADNLAVRDGALLASSGNAIFSVRPQADPMLVQAYPSVVTALAVSPSGEFYAALESGRLVAGETEVSLPSEVKCITALVFAPDGSLWLANGSANHSPSAWATDLMQKSASGSVWRRDAGASDFRKVAGDLAFPFGLLAEANGVIVSESWRHRLLRIDGTSGRTSPVINDLPGYPARLSLSSDGGAWLSIFAPRNRLIEFVLQETHYRRDMMAEVPSDEWIAPALSSGRSFLEPLQCGAIRTMGVHKPWSPSRSYGLVVRLDARMQPLYSLHSRANGTRHGICSAVELKGQLFAASKGGDCIVTVDTVGLH